jgi:hypothetical protein
MAAIANDPAMLMATALTTLISSSVFWANRTQARTAPRRGLHVSCGRLIHEQGNALAGSDGPSLIDIGERAHASHTSPGSWSVFSDRSDKPIDVDGESILKDHSVRVDGNEPRCAAGAVVFHRVGKDAERRTALVAEGNSEAVALLVEGQLVARIDVGALECGLDCGDPDILGAGILNQRLESWKSVRVAATAPMLVEKEEPVPRAELLQGERRAFLSLSIDPIGDREFRGRLSSDALGHDYTRSSDCGEVHAVAAASRPRSPQPALLPWNWLVKL